MKIIVRFTKYSKHMIDADHISYATDDNGEYSDTSKVTVYLDPSIVPAELDNEIEFTEVYALNEDGSRSFKRCVTLEDFHEFLEEERRHLKGDKTKCEVKLL